MSADRVLEVVEASRVGRFAGKVFEGSRRFDLMLLLPPATLTPEAFGEVMVGSSTGHLVPGPGGTRRAGHHLRHAVPDVGDLRYAIAVFVNVPLALIGGVPALRRRGLPFSIPAAVGFIAVAGVAVLNGVVMAGELARRLKLSAGDFEAEIRASAGTVFRPVITTALVAALGFIPTAISTHAGAECNGRRPPW